MLFQDASPRVRPRARAHLWAFQQAWLSLRHSTPSKRSQPRCCTRQPGGGERTLGNANHTQVGPILLRFDLKEKAVGGGGHNKGRREQSGGGLGESRICGASEGSSEGLLLETV